MRGQRFQNVSLCFGGKQALSLIGVVCFLWAFVFSSGAFARPAVFSPSFFSTVSGALWVSASLPVRKIKKLKVDQLRPGRYHFIFKAGLDNGGLPMWVPVIVIKGKNKGPKLMLTAAIHGDELNGIRTIHQLMDKISPDDLAGSIIAIPGVNRSGMSRHSRYFHDASGGGSVVDLNRVMPGRKTGNAGERFAYSLWQHVLKDNADIAIDLHTQTRGTVYPLYVFADFNNQTSKEMAFLLGPDVIKQDTGLTGTLETSFMTVGVPAVTFEIGAPKVFQKKLVARAVAGIRRVMQAQGMLTNLSPATAVPAPKVQPFVGKKITTIKAHTGGILVVNVKLLDRVKAGQIVGCLYDAFGVKLKCYKAPHNSLVLALATDPLREAGSMVVRLLR